MKFGIRNSKFEANSNVQMFKCSKRMQSQWRVLFRILSFEFLSNSEFRNLNFAGGVE